MDMDAALKDGYSLAEVNAEAARRTGFKYDSAKSDGFSDEDINQELRKRLSKAAIPAGDGEGFLDKAIGVGQAAATTVTGGIGAAVGWIPAAIQKANDPSHIDFEKQFAANMEAMTYEPSREKGQEYAGKVGGFVNDTLLPAATGVQGLPYVNTAAPLLGAIGRNLTKASKMAERPAGRLAADLGKESEIPVDPNAGLYKQRALEQQQAAIAEQQAKGEQPIVADQQGRAATAEQGGNPSLIAEDPMARMARDLGAEPGKVEVPQGPMESFYDRLTKDEGTGKTQMAQDIIDERAKDHNVRSDFLAKQAAEQDAANLAAARNMDSNPSAQHKAHVERVAAEESHRSQLEESHAHALDEQVRLEEAQASLEARQKAIDASMSGVKSQFEGVRQLTAEGGPRTEQLAFEAELRKRQAEAPEKSRKQLAIEAKAELAAEKQRIVERRAANEEIIQKLRDQHSESEIRTLQAQANAQEALAKRDSANTAGTIAAAKEAAALRKQADALAKDKAKRDKALRAIAKQHALQEITHPLGSKERIAAVKAVNEKFSDVTGGAPKKPVQVKGNKQSGKIKEDLLGVGSIHKLMAKLKGESDHARYGWDATMPKSVFMTPTSVTKLISEFKGTFTRKSLVEAVNQSVKGKDGGWGVHLVMMSPAEFLKMAAQRGGDLSKDLAEFSQGKHQRIRAGLETEGGLDAIPYLQMDKAGQVTGHEGRHRMDIFQAKGLDRIPVKIMVKEEGNLPKSFRDQTTGWMTHYPEYSEQLINHETRGEWNGKQFSTDEPVSQAFINSQTGQGGKLLMSWGAKKKSEAFSGIPGLKDTLRDIGNAMIGSPKEAIALAKEFGDVSQNTLQKGINLLTKGGTYLKSKVDNPVVHYTVDRFLSADSKAKAEISEKLHGEYLSALRDLSKEEYHDAFTLLNAADLSKKEITPAMMQQYGLSTKLQDFISTHQNMMADVLGKINTAREAVGKKPISAREAYSAMTLSGDYRKVAYKTIDGVRTVVGVISSDRKAGKLGWTLSKIEKHMLDKDPTLEFGPLKDTTTRVGSTKGTPHEAFQDALDTIGQNNPHVQQFLDTLKEVAKDDINNYMGMQTHTMQKKGVWGMEGRKPWMKENQNATQFFENQTKYIEGAFNWSHLAEAAKEVNEVLRDKDVVSKQENAIKMSESYMQNALGLNPSRVGRAIEEVVNAIGNRTIGPSNLRGVLGGVKAGVNTALLSFNPSFLAIQLVQGPAAMPAMAALLRGRGLAPKATILSGGLNYMASAGTALLKDPSKLSAVDKGALKYAKDNHVYATDMVEHSNTTTKGAMYYTNYATQHPAALIEQATRAQVYLAYVKMMDESGLKVKDGLYEQAHRLTDQTMNNYGALEKPAIYNALGPIGSMAYNLKSFGHNEISRWSMLAREIEATGNAVPLLTQMASTITLAGVMGLPFYSQWESIYDMITSKMGTPRNLTLDVMEASEKLSKSLGDDYGTFKNVMSHGAATTLGMDLSTRIGLGDVLPNKASDAAFAGGSKLTTMVSSVAGAIVHPDEPHLKAAAVNLAPSLVAAPLKEAWYTDGDKAYSMDPSKPTKVVATLNATDKLLKKIGITGINESTQKEREYQLGQLDKTYQDKRDTAIVGMSFALAHNGDLDPYIQKYLDNQGDPASLVATINSTIDSVNVDPNTRAIIRDSASKSLTRILSLQRRMEHQ